MWISKKEYEHLRAIEEGHWAGLESWRRTYKVDTEKLVNLERENNKLKQMVIKWKQKFFDIINFVDDIYNPLEWNYYKRSHLHG